MMLIASGVWHSATTLQKGRETPRLRDSPGLQRQSLTPREVASAAALSSRSWSQALWSWSRHRHPAKLWARRLHAQNGPALICCSSLFPGGSFLYSLWDLGLVSWLLGAVLSSAAWSSPSPAAQGFPEGMRDAQGERQLSFCGREFSWRGRWEAGGPHGNPRSVALGRCLHSAPWWRRRIPTA